MTLEVIEVGPRDGLQNEPVPVPTDAKITYLEALVAAGVRRIEAVSFVHPGRVPQMADAERVMARAPRVPGLRYAGLVLNERGLDRALETGVDEVNVVVVATETFSLRNQGMPVERAVETFGAVAARARAAGLGVTLTVGAAFGCPFEGEVDPGRVAELVARCPEAQEVALADTIGVGTPADVRRLTAAVREVTAAPLRFHFHNTRSTGYANAVAAMETGAAALDASAGGIGGCPFAPEATGNIATEDLVYLLERMGVSTGIALPAVAGAGLGIGRSLGKQVPAQLGRVAAWPP
ncbi:Hydroxymethylglutaryl-CoA lyase YngG [Nonomuraea coxensis DSM 45129]|uniref:Hydroxymethylglutaryl-CoA lyase YngG n=1 Tax=Nonomuraea coxensis DSM 45129 TaxID=1122611 RepID=A0ABX8TXV6_9ACTN|nr:hydroxymethylglutaryl-CoA lyase [Nonomuraea coxensis]QYC40118.1 Hydroxymethylglutaryl-CoA lyase YngG [Nonomuraea coxensis DSM 45129]